MALKPFETTWRRIPYAIQQDLQEMMQDLVGIVRNEEEMLEALNRIGCLSIARRKVVLRETLNTILDGIPQSI